MHLCAQADSTFQKDITAGDYRVFLTNSEHGFFTGSIQIADKFNNTVFYQDSFFTRYNRDSLIDLDNNGSKELILDLGTGALMYDYNMFLIFDFGKKDINPLEVHNAELITSENQLPEILSYVRLSPSVLGAGYSFTLKYEKGNLVLTSGNDKNNLPESNDQDDIDEIYSINDYKQNNDECAEYSQIMVYFEAYLMKQKLTGQEQKGWEFFDKNYNCPDKEIRRSDLKKLIDQTYSEIKDPESYRFRYGY